MGEKTKWLTIIAAVILVGGFVLAVPKYYYHFAHCSDGEEIFRCNTITGSITRGILYKGSDGKAHFFPWTPLSALSDYKP